MTCPGDPENPFAPRSERPQRRPLDLAYTEIGDPEARPLILLVGLGMQMFEWPGSFLKALSGSHRVICVENRDAGQSPRCGPESEPDIAGIWLPGDAARARELAPYTLFDMRDDVFALLARLNIRDFDVIGFSMGGMIAQLVSAMAGDRVGAFVQLASNDGTIHVDGTDDAKRRMARLFTEPEERRQIIEYLLDDTLYYGAGQLQPDDDLRAGIEKAYMQGFSCGGSARHALAVLAAGDRRAQLRTISARTLVLHGNSDPCIAAHRGRAAAELIPDATFKLLPGVGHIVDEQMCNAALAWLRPQRSGPSVENHP